MREVKTLQIFKTGSHTAMGGQDVSMGYSDLLQIASAYRPALHKAPLVLGHPEGTGAPRYGDVLSLSVRGDGLFAEAEVDPELVEWVRKRRYTNVSAGFYPPDHPANPAPGLFYLNHVGILGAHAPAVKGMAPLEFAEGSKAREINPLVRDAERRNLPPDHPGRFDFSEGAARNPLVRDAEARYRADQSRKRVWP